MVRLVVIVVAVGWASVAVADDPAFEEQLTKDELKAAGDAVVAALPAVDKPAAEKCKALPLDTSAQLGTAAGCLRRAGALGAAIQLWREAVRIGAGTREGAEAQHQLGPAYEAAGLFAEAAAAHTTWAEKYAKQADARERMIRAICLYRQLGDHDAATRGFARLRSMWRKPKPIAKTLCATVRPIVVPQPSP